MGEVFFISDTHWGHRNIIPYGGRPFKDIHHMDETLIQNWTETVRPEDDVYHLGDFTLSRDPSYLGSLIRRLPGRIHLLRGNHDGLPGPVYLREGVSEILPEGWKRRGRAVVKVGGRWVHLSHEPPEVNLVASIDCVYLHGHIHQRVVDPPLRGTFNVSVEAIGYRPRRLEEILKGTYDGRNLETN